MADEDSSYRKDDRRNRRGGRGGRGGKKRSDPNPSSPSPSFYAAGGPSSDSIKEIYDRRGASDRGGRARIARETLEIATNYGNGSYTTKSGTEVSGIGVRTKLAVDNTELYEPHRLKSLIKSELEQSEVFLSLDIEVRQCYVLKAAEDLAKSGLYKNVAVLNFASAKNPGGGFLNGASAHEESIARSSGLYPCLTESVRCGVYYGENKKDKTCVYTDHMIFSPAVPVFRNDRGDLLEEPYDVSIITAPAVNAGAARKRINGNPDEVIADTMRLRIKGVLAIAKKHQCDAIILGAWGCGCFRNDPIMIAKLFAQGLRVLGSSFKKIVFAIDDEEKCDVFRDALASLTESSEDTKHRATNSTSHKTGASSSSSSSSTSSSSSSSSGRNRVSAGFLIKSGGLYLVCHATKRKPFHKGRDRYDGAWTISKGMVERGEADIEAAKRELLEETGIDLNDPDLSPLLSSVAEPISRYITARGKNVVVYLIEDPKGTIMAKYPVEKLCCTSLIEGSRTLEKNGLPEMDGFAWVTAEEAPLMVFSNQQHLFALKQSQTESTTTTVTTDTTTHDA